jgi:hypothetical protein
LPDVASAHILPASRDPVAEVSWKNIKLNWLAILVAAIVSFLFEALWFTVFMNQWLDGIGSTKEWLLSASTTTVTPGIQYAKALICSLIAATILSVAIQATGEQTILRRVICAISPE